MDELPTDARVTELGRRVRWLDRYRRIVAVTASIVLAPVWLFEIMHLLGDDWPGAHAAMLALFAAVFTWWVIEVSLAWVTAVWETEYDKLLRDHGLPPARVVVRE